MHAFNTPYPHFVRRGTLDFPNMDAKMTEVENGSKREGSYIVTCQASGVYIKGHPSQHEQPHHG